MGAVVGKVIRAACFCRAVGLRLGWAGRVSRGAAVGPQQGAVRGGVAAQLFGVLPKTLVAASVTEPAFL